MSSGRRAIATATAFALVAFPLMAAAERWTAIAIPHPRLEGFEPEARDAILARRRAVDELSAAADSPLAGLAAAYGELGKVYLAFEQEAAAEAALRNAAGLQPEEPRWVYYLGLLADERHDFAAAADRFAAVTVLEPRQVAAWVRLGDARLAAGQHQPAEVAYAAALDLDPAFAAAHYGRARLALARGDDDDAIQSLEAALASQPEARKLHALLAQALRRQGANELAAKHATLYAPTDVAFPEPFLAEIRDGIESAEFHAEAAEHAANEGRNDFAVHSYERALELDPENVRAIRGLASLAERAGDVERAIELYGEAAHAAPDDPRLRFHLGRLYARQGRWTEAREELEASLRLDPESEEARVALAAVLVHLGNQLAVGGDHGTAAQLFAEALDRQPDHVGARLAHATALLLAGRAAEARDSLIAGLRATPGEPNLTHALARLLASSPDRAVRDGQRALELARNVFEQAKTMEHAEAVAMAYAEIGAFEDAARWQRTLLAEAERLGDAAWIARLRANLERYERHEAP